MLEAKKVSVWRSRYDISTAGRPVASWDGAFWKTGGSFELDGRRYEVRGSTWGSKFSLVDADGTTIAATERVGRKRWTVEAAGAIYRFQRASPWRHEEELHVEGRRVGSVKRTSAWRNEVVAELPGLPLPLQIFVLGVVLTMWDQRAAATASTAGA